MVVVAPWTKTRCVYCFSRFHLSAAPRRLTNGPLEKDPVVGRFLGVPPPDMGRVERTPQSLLAWFCRRVLLPTDWGEARKICPQCHLFLTNAAAGGHLHPQIVAIIGTRNSGKSNFFGVLLHALAHRYSVEIGFHIYDQETFWVKGMRPITSDALYRVRYGDRLFNARAPTAVPQTSRAELDPDLRIPLIYRVEFPGGSGWLGGLLARPRAMDLVIFDSAGEDLKDGDPRTLETFYRYLLDAAGIIFLIDPTQVPGMRALLPAEIQRRCPMDPNDQPTQLLARIINLFQTGRGLSPGQKVRIPVAFAFSKSDLLMNLVDRTSLIRRDSRHEGGFHLSDCEQVSEEVARYLSRWGERHLTELIDGKFADYRYFALSALGQLPADGSLAIQPVSPTRVADPVLWLLWRLGYISASTC